MRSRGNRGECGDYWICWTCGTSFGEEFGGARFETVLGFEWLVGGGVDCGVGLFGATDLVGGRVARWGGNGGCGFAVAFGIATTQCLSGLIGLKRIAMRFYSRLSTLGILVAVYVK